jgi:hypothetical protein
MWGVHRSAVGAFVLALLIGSASAQPTDATCARLTAILTGFSGEHLTSANAPGLRALADETPQRCDIVHRGIEQLLARAAQNSAWRALDEQGQIVIVDPPASMSREVEVATFRGTITADMMEARPSQEDVNRLHPRRAREREQVGAVILEGLVTSDGTLVWRVENEAPIGWGFGDAAIRAAALFRAPTMYEGRPTVGARYHTVIAFTAPPIRVIYYE